MGDASKTVLQMTENTANHIGQNQKVTNTERSLRVPYHQLKNKRCHLLPNCQLNSSAYSLPKVT